MRGVAGPPGIGVGGKGPFQRLSCLVGTSRPPGGGAKQLEIRRVKSAVAVGRKEHLHRLRPGVSVHRVATELDCLDHLETHRLT